MTRQQNYDTFICLLTDLAAGEPNWLLAVGNWRTNSPSFLILAPIVYARSTGLLIQSLFRV
ncbi:MAG: hypothetical protein HC862_11985 [Scytonema sp. RU_4_4]|nr:hypothetical protein [Scytonema sp. RU_4_4]